MIELDELKRRMHYDPDTGHFTRLTTEGKHKAGDRAGCIVNNYIAIEILGRRYLGHRLAWFYMEGYFPIGAVKHHNNIPTDNKWKNLYTKQSIGKTPAFKGIIWLKREQRWRAQFCENGGVVNLGNFRSEFAAKRAYDEYVEERNKQLKIDPRIATVLGIIERNPKMSIRSISVAQGIGQATLRHWESEGLIPRVHRRTAAEMKAHWRSKNG